MKHPTRRWALASTLLCSTGSVLVASPAHATHTADHAATLYAAEVFAWEGDPVTTATCDAQTSIPGMADAGDLPAGSTAAIDVEGPLQRVTGDDSCRTWMIGGVPVAAPFSADPQLAPGSMVRAVGAAEVADPTMVVAERIRDRERTGVGAAEIELLYLAELTVVDGDLVVPTTGGQCVTVPNDVWTVTDQEDQSFELDVSAARAAGGIDPCTAPGDVVGAEFDLQPIEEEAAEPSGPVLFDPATGIGLVDPVTGTGLLDPVIGVLMGLPLAEGPEDPEEDVEEDAEEEDAEEEDTEQEDSEEEDTEEEDTED